MSSLWSPWDPLTYVGINKVLLVISVIGMLTGIIMYFAVQKSYENDPKGGQTLQNVSVYIMIGAVLLLLLGNWNMNRAFDLMSTNLCWNNSLQFRKKYTKFYESENPDI